MEVIPLLPSPYPLFTLAGIRLLKMASSGRNTYDAGSAFQATFLIRSIRDLQKMIAKAMISEDEETC